MIRMLTSLLVPNTQQFKDRTEAGNLLAHKLEQYKDKDVIVYALPRGGVVTALEIARELHAPLDLIITRKITHPYSPEYAIAAINESGQIIGSRHELMMVDEDWLEEEAGKQQEEIRRRREQYLPGISMISPTNSIAIIVDDGVATGLTLRVSIRELNRHHPQKIIVAVPIIPKSTAVTIAYEIDELVAIEIPSDTEFLGAVGAYYNDFKQISDDQVIRSLNKYNKERSEEYDKAMCGDFTAKDFLL
jgi:putative phosphoribosyl transferase